MKCFYHPVSFAIGVCKNCGKGVCKKCAVDLVDGLACRGKCEEKAKAIIQMIEKGKRAYEKTSAVYRNFAIQAFFGGLVCLAIGFYFGNVAIGYFSSIFFLGAFFSILASRKFQKNN
jgi:hypothetical protein